MNEWNDPMNGADDGWDSMAARHLRARLATVEGERDAAKEASAKDREWVGRALEKQAEYLGQSQMLVAERDAAFAGEARAVEALGTLNHAAKVAISTNYGNSDDEDTPLTIRLLDGTCDATDEALTAARPALAWLAQQRAEAAEAERNANTDVIRSLGPDFCDFFFGGPGEAEYLAGVLRAQRAEAAAEALENIRIGWLTDNDYRPGIPEIWRYIADRAAALRAGATGGDRE
jgi:hypothetical protein